MRKLLIALFILAVLLVGADFAGRAIAESKTGEAIAQRASITPAPGVDIHGFSFLWQAVRGEYGHITLTANDLRSNGLTGIDIAAELYDVTLPLSDALGGRADQLTAGRADVTARIPSESLGTVLNQPRLRVTGGADNAVRVSTTLSAAGQSLPVTAEVSASVTDNTLRLTGERLVGELPGGLNASLADQFVRQLNFSVPLTDLPVTIASGSVRADGSTLVVTAETRNVQIGRLISAGR